LLERERERERVRKKDISFIIYYIVIFLRLYYLQFESECSAKYNIRIYTYMKCLSMHTILHNANFMTANFQILFNFIDLMRL